MVHVDVATGALCVNTAVVPRAKAGKYGTASKRHFCEVAFEGTHVTHVSHIWVDVDEATGSCEVAERQEMLRRGEEGQLQTWNSYVGAWESAPCAVPV